MKIVVTFIIMMMPFMACNVYSQECEKNIDSEKLLEERIDSLKSFEAEKAITDKHFVLEADKVEFKRGETVFVNSNTNFVSVADDKSVVQVSFNVLVSGPNGIGGITLDGNISNYKQKQDKKGNISISMNVMGAGISAVVNIVKYAGSNKASVTISPNFNSNRITLSGYIVPYYKSRVFKGNSI